MIPAVGARRHSSMPSSPPATHRTVKPDLLLLAMRDLGVTRAEAVLVDDEPSQVAAATGMGISAILIRRDAAGTTEAGDAATTVVRDLAELADHALGGLTTPRG